MRCSTQPNKSDATPEQLPFPPEGSAESERFLSMARDGRIVFGTNSAGEEAIWDLREEPSALIAGVTGSGKSAAATLPIFAAVCCPDMFDLIVVDSTDEFAWTAQFLNVRHITGLNAASYCVKELGKELSGRQALLTRRQERNLKSLREMYAVRPKCEAEDGPAPKRLLVVLNDFDAGSMTDAANAVLEALSRFSRAVEINLLVTVQRPTGMSPHLRNQLSFRLCLGAIDRDSSRALSFTDAAVEATLQGALGPRGRAWVGSARLELRFPAIRVPYLPMTTKSSPWDSAVELEGAEERALRRQMTRGDARE